MGLLGLSLSLGSLGCVFALVALWNSWQIRRLLRSHSIKSALEASVQLAAHASSLESLSTTVRRLSSRYGMQQKRGPDGRAVSQLTGADWKAEARQRYITPGRPVQHEE